MECEVCRGSLFLVFVINLEWIVKNIRNSEQIHFCNEQICWALPRVSQLYTFQTDLKNLLSKTDIPV